MNTQQIVNRGLRLTHTNPNDYDIEKSVEDLNLVYQDMVDEIVVGTKGDYSWDTGCTETVVNQSEYVAEKIGISPEDLDIKKINKVFVRYNTTDEFPRRLTYQNPGVLDKHPDWYKKNQLETEAFFYIQDSSIFIYPSPKIAIEDALELFVVHKPADLDMNSSEDDIEIPSQFHKVIADGLKEYIYQSQGKINESQVAMQEYKAGVRNMVAFMKQRYNQPRSKTISGLDNFR